MNYPGTDAEPYIGKKPTMAFRSIERRKKRESGSNIYLRQIAIDKFTSANPTVEFDNQKYSQKMTTDNRFDNHLNKHIQQFPN